VNSTLRALNRFGLGARLAEAHGIRDPRGWLRAQLDGGPPLAAVPAASSPAEIADALRAFRGAGPKGPERQEARRRLVGIAAAEAREALTHRVRSERPFVERLVAFWSNHLCVSAGAKVLVAPLAGSYERDAIRPHVLGRFEDMVLASARHPAMLFYLDNFQSVGPGSRGGRLARNGSAPRGLNENYARELLELHTLGVNGGYTQRDVQELAKILTGWTVSGLAARGRQRQRLGARGRTNVRADGPIAFAYEELLHEPGTKTVMNRQYSGGMREGEDAIKALCHHLSTATFIATKLVTHFVADQPPEAAVSRIARVFRESEGDLRAVSRALVELPEAWSEATRKFRTPQEWLVAVLRAVDAPETGDRVAPVLRQLRHPLWSPPAPKGYGDSLQEWADPDSLLNRAELARTMARQLGRRGIDPKALVSVVDIAGDDPLHALVADASIPPAERVALVVAGPAFQWR
jgi:uncharacterized protein (DUF1800 family)